MTASSLIRAAAVAIALLALDYSQATSGPWIETTGCDVVTVNGNQYNRIHFTVHNISTDSSIFEVTCVPEPYQVPGDTCHAVQTVAPAGWVVVSNGYHSSAWATSSAPIAPGNSQAGFITTLSRPTCCFLVNLGDIFETFASESVCWTCPLATPTSSTSWGTVKVIYR